MKKKLFALLLALTLILSLSASVFAYTVPSDTVVYVTETGSCYHRWDCSHLKSVGASYTISDADALGYFPCSRCNPDWLTGTYVPPGSHPSSSGSSFSPSDDLAPTVSIDVSADSDVFPWWKTAIAILFCPPIAIFIYSFIAYAVDSAKTAIRKKKKPITDEDGKPLPF